MNQAMLPSTAADPSDHLQAYNTLCGLFFLYESFIPITAIVFYIAAYKPGSYELKQIIQLVIKTKRILEEDPLLFNKFENLSFKEQESGVSSNIGEAIVSRNKIINKDKSFIFKGYIQEAIDSAKTCEIKELKRKNREEESKKETEYAEMIKRLRYHVDQGENVMERMKLEKQAFYRQHKRMSKSESLRVRRKLSLGGSIVDPGYLIEMIKRVNNPLKEQKVYEWVHRILGPIQELELRMRFLLPHEKKAEVEKFLESCLVRRGAAMDAAFEARSEIIRMAYKSKEERERENLRQEVKIMELIEVIRELDVSEKDDWLVKYNSDIEREYAKYLITRTDGDKLELMKLLL